MHLAIQFTFVFWYDFTDMLQVQASVCQGAQSICVLIIGVIIFEHNFQDLIYLPIVCIKRVTNSVKSLDTLVLRSQLTTL